tara:strand:+ start:198 stop:497 length:300 start_codon:yes stop_codon:yes gene_type:complete
MTRRRRRRPLTHYFTKASLGNINIKPQIDLIPLKKINNKILKHRLKINNLIDTYIVLLRGNTSKHKEFLIKTEIEKEKQTYKLLVNEKKELILKMMKSI